MVGPAGLSGAHAQEPVGMASSTVEDIVTILCPNMEEENAMGPTSVHALAKSNLAQVNLTFIGLKLRRTASLPSTLLCQRSTYYIHNFRM